MSTLCTTDHRECQVSLGICCDHLSGSASFRLQKMGASAKEFARLRQGPPPDNGLTQADPANSLGTETWRTASRRADPFRRLSTVGTALEASVLGTRHTGPKVQQTFSLEPILTTGRDPADSIATTHSTSPTRDLTRNGETGVKPIKPTELRLHETKWTSQPAWWQLIRFV